MFAKILAFFLILLAAVAEAAVMPYWLKTGRLDKALMLHAVAILICLVSYRFAERRRLLRVKDKPIHLFAMGTLAVFPVMGILGVICLYGALVAERFGWRQGIFEDYGEYVSERGAGSGEFHYQQNALQQFRKEMSFKPLSDIMMGREVSLKAKAINKLSKELTSENIFLLQQATRDLSPDVRLYAATALLKIERDINEKILRAAETAKREGSARSFSELGDLYWRYAKSGILEKKLSDYYLRLGADAYRNSLDCDTNQPALISRYFDCLMELGEYQKAKNLMDHAVRLWPQDDELIFHRNHVYYELRHFNEVQASFKQTNQEAFSEGQKEVVQFWTEEN